MDAYLAKPDKLAFPKMDAYDLTLMFTRAISSSPNALAGLADHAYGRVKERELYDIATAASDIQPKSVGKGRELLAAIKRGFAELKKRGANRKAIIFTGSLPTLGFLHRLLSGSYKVLTYDGSKSTDYSIIKRFENEAEILIATDVAAEGFHMAFCSFLINYDLPYNVLTIEQRINRCHRQEQKSDVIVLSFLNPNNFADVRMLELINKRILQFDGIMGMADDVIGGFSSDVSQGLDDFAAVARTTAEIDRTYQETLTRFEDENKKIVAQAESVLFTTFMQDIAISVTITPQYIKVKTEEINNKLWDLTKYFFGGKYAFHLDDDTRTLSCVGAPPKVFTGAAMRRNEYSMAKGYQPASGRHTIAGTLARNILHEIFWVGVPDRGGIVVDRQTEPCTIALYRVKVKSQADYFSAWYYSVFAGKTMGGRILSHDDCVEIMELPVVSFTKEVETYGERDVHLKEKPSHELDRFIEPDEYIQRTITENATAEKEEIDRLKAQAITQKASLNRQLDSLRSSIRTVERKHGEAKNTLENLEANKQLAVLRKELKQGEQGLFMESRRADMECERQIQLLLDKAKYSAEIRREFVIKVEGV